MTQLPTLFARGAHGKVLVWTMFINGNLFRAETGMKDGKLIPQAWTVCQGKNLGKKNETTPEEQAEKEAKAEWDKKVKRYYFEDESRIDEFVFVEPMLCETYKSPAQVQKEIEAIKINPQFETEEQKISEIKKLKKFTTRHKELVEIFENGGHVWVDIKFDGIRDEVTSKGMWTRRGEKCVSAPHIFEAISQAGLFDEHPALVLDGEVYNHDLRDELNQINSLASKKKPTPADLAESKAKLRYYVYDGYNFGDITSETPFEERKKALKKLIFGIPFLVYVESQKVSSIEELNLAHEEAVADGYEGTVIKHNGPYEAGDRSNRWLKRKDFEEEEFEIFDILPGIGKKSEVAGYAWAFLPNGEKFKTNIKGNYKFLRELLVDKNKFIGKKATIRFLKYTEYGIPYIPYIITFPNDK